jgi:hypothetical protein
VLDSTDFWWTNTRTQQRRREIAVLVAHGYTTTGRHRVWGIHASPTAQRDDHLDLLTGLQLLGPPRTIAADDDRAIAAAVRAVWPTPTPGVPRPRAAETATQPATQPPRLLVETPPFLLLCEHHLRERARAALRQHAANAPLGRWMRRLDTAFRRPEGWEEFRDVVQAELGGAPAAWVCANDAVISRQVAHRYLLPAHYSTAAEADSARLRGLFERRSFSLRNARRTNLLLGLARLHLNNRDDVGVYHRLLRAAAEQGAGRAVACQRGNRDPRGPAGAAQPSLR